MNVVSLVGSLSRLAGGLFESVRRLDQELASPADCAQIEGRLSEPIQVSVLGIRDSYSAVDLQHWKPVPAETFRPLGPGSFGFAAGLLTRLSKMQPVLVHTHGLWQYPSLAALLWHRRTKRPYIVSPHGMLDPWALTSSRWKKRCAWWAYERAHLKRASCLRALCQPEAEAMGALGLGNPICVIPNGVDLPEHPVGSSTGLSRVTSSTSDSLEIEAEARSRGWPATLRRRRKILLFLGRIHPKKGLVALVKAWANLPKKQDWLLVIAGWEQAGHRSELERLATQLSIPWVDLSLGWDPGATLLFAGPQFDAAKQAWFDACDAFILPSFSEGLPMAVLEAWSFSKPVLMTPECNLAEGFFRYAAIAIKPAPVEMSATLTDLLARDHASLTQMGANGRALVESRFSWPRVAASLRRVYEWLVGIGSQPECVYNSLWNV